MGCWNHSVGAVEYGRQIEFLLEAPPMVEYLKPALGQDKNHSGRTLDGADPGSIRIMRLLCLYRCRAATNSSADSERVSWEVDGQNATSRLSLSKYGGLFSPELGESASKLGVRKGPLVLIV